MKRNLILFVVLVGLLALACQDTELKYNSHDNVYFDLSGQDGDTVRAFTFAYDPTQGEDTVFFPVKVAGKRLPVDRQLKVTIDPNTTTAIPDLHYKPLESFYTLPADSGIFNVPLIVYNKDKNLESSSVMVTLKLESSEDLGTGISKYLTSSVTVSNQLEQPSWWVYWMGDYTKVKHALYLISIGNVDLVPPLPPTGYLSVPFCLYIQDKFRQFLTNPQAWVATNDKGYVLTQRGDGNYDFYTPDNPFKVYLLRKNVNDGKYYFIDENDNQIVL